MATKQFYATGSFKYGTRMLRAGDPVELDAPNARLYTALGKISSTRPRPVPAGATAAAQPVQPPAETTRATTPAPKKAVPRKRATAKK
ncbi:MAG TPA: hypothetical protein VFG41_00620 [Sphingomicrobium sp.]|nr:hypothetical protein [Sphingomicrobium sp.]